MQFSHIIALIAGAAVTMALPTELVDRNNPVPTALCPAGLYSNPQCCATDVLGVADLDCATPTSPAADSAAFAAVCAASGQRARCCVLPAVSSTMLLRNAGIGLTCDLSARPRCSVHCPPPINANHQSWARGWYNNVSGRWQDVVEGER